jgi:hypothetical protein
VRPFKNKVDKLDSVKNREEFKAKIRKIKGQVESQLRQEEQVLWSLYLEKRQAARESVHFKPKPEDPDQSRNVSVKLIERYFRKVVKDCREAEGMAQTSFNNRNALSSVEIRVKADDRRLNQSAHIQNGLLHRKPVTYAQSSNALDTIDNPIRTSVMSMPIRQAYEGYQHNAKGCFEFEPT